MNESKNWCTRLKFLKTFKNDVMTISISFALGNKNLHSLVTELCSHIGTFWRVTAQICHL